MDDLTVIGFAAVGHWTLSSKTNSGITFKLESHGSERVVYAFVVGDTPKYIGICDRKTTTLKARMGRYRARQGNGANERVARRILECLQRGDSVEILALRPSGQAYYGNLALDLVRGLENPLIERFNPEWNIFK